MGETSKSSNPTELSTDIKEVVNQIEWLANQQSDSADNGLSDKIRLGKYEIRQLLATTGQALVLLGVDPLLQRQVTIKIYHSGVDQLQRQRMLSEGQALARINSSFVADCYGIEDFDGELGLVIEYISGRPLRSLETEPRSFVDVARLVHEITQGVRAVHQAGLLHRDLKPSNVLVNDDNHPKIIDFGLVQNLGQPNGSGSSGTPTFMPPETARGDIDSIDQRSDIFGIGAILYFILTGKAPFEADSTEVSRKRAIEGRVLPVGEHNPLVPKQLVEVCMKCLRFNQNDRYQNADELLNVLDRYVSGVTRRRVLVFGAAAIGLFGGTALLGNSLWKNPPNSVGLPEDVQHFLEMLSRGEIPSTRDDFGLMVDVFDINDPANRSFEMTNGQLKLTEDRKVRVTVKSANHQPFELRGYSIQWDPDQQKLGEIVLLDIGLASTDLTPYRAPCREYLLFVAEARDSATANATRGEESTDEAYRGVKSSADAIHPVSQLIIPYVVRPATEAQETPHE